MLALLAVWLLPQRDDIGAALIEAAIFGGALALAIPRLEVTRRSVTAATAGALVALAVRVAAPRPVLLFVAFGCVAAAAVIFTSIDARRSRTRPERAIVTLTVAFAVAFALYVGAVSPRATWFGGGTLHGATTRREVALTFDDGPNLGATLPIMDILDRYGVKGTFFEVGKAVAIAPQISRALIAHGHLIGDHSYHHDSWRWLDPRYPELQRTQDVIERETGVCPALYRPPHGERTPFLAHAVDDHHMHMVLWNVSAGDWATDDAALIARRVLVAAKPGAIILLHDGLDGNPTANRQVLVRALPLILDALRARHLEPVRLDRLLATPAYVQCSR